MKKEHILALKGTKKSNVDTDIVFEIMKNLIDNKDFEPNRNPAPM
jgi:hypothetical protein